MELTSSQESPESLLFPCIVCVGNKLLQSGRRDARQTWLKGHFSGNRFLFKHGCTPYSLPRFIVDREGLWRSVTILRLRRRWVRYVIPITFWDCVLVEAEVAPGERLSNATLLERISKVGAKPPFNLARKLRSFLKEQPPGAPFTATTFRRFWDTFCRDLPPGEWEDAVPRMRRRTSGIWTPPVK